MAEKIIDTWYFPLPRTHTGILLGNGLLGAMVWGGDNILKVTLGRADLWDHRGGIDWTEKMNYFHLRRLLEAGDEQNLRQIFEGHEPPSSGQPRRPTVLPVGRLELHFPDGFRLRTGHLDTHSGHLTVLAENGQTCRLEFDLAMKEVLLLVTWTSRLKPVEIVRVPAWEFVGEYLRSISFTEPEMFSTASVSGWVQPRPADPPYCVAYQKGQNCLLVTISTGATGRKAVTRAATLLAACRKRLEALCKENKRWWSNYWESLPKVSLPNERLQFLYRYGLYKFAGLTNPAGVPATLQGPWIEEYQMPPWSSDYHFNINVQMCYWPAYQANRLQHLLPLFRMVWSWREQLRQNARLFAGINDGYVLPHAVDDRGKCMGGFWTGTIDHGCTAWVGKMMYDYYLYGGEKEFLAEIAYPFMEGAMKVFTVMLEKRGGGWYLPVSVSPEYRGAAMNAWGANSSFQLACIHWLIEALQNSCRAMGKNPDPLWLDIQQHLPRACVQQVHGQKKIMVWEGTDLEESHRHHSHWAGLVPFDVIDLNDPGWKEIVNNTYDWWWRQGMGLWSGWCIPWAAMIHGRAGSPEIAEALIEYWQRLYTNEGHGTLHDAVVYKRSLKDRPDSRIGTNREVMQMDAGMAATAAILDFLVHTRRGIHYLFSGAPSTWREVSFKKIRTEGAFLVSAWRSGQQAGEIEVSSERSGLFRLATPWPEKTTVRLGRRKISLKGKIVEVLLRPGETARFSPG